ncbi:hypothetical protein ACFUCQ_05345 [Streptomyces sp. NPDC057197]|uniref:hypothetical protein n=1 Tax=Streptomyces sp. NPDC057197 TaxID=3346045 RepID=UPI003630574A
MSSVVMVVVDDCPVALSGRQDGAMRMWDLTTGRYSGAALRGHASEVTSAAAAGRQMSRT